MIRYVKIDMSNLFAWYCTVRDEFCSFGGETTWLTWEDFEEDWLMEGSSKSDLSRFKSLYPVKGAGMAIVDSEVLSKDNKVVVDVSNCARCGGGHYHLIFAKLRYPCDDLTHWCICPVEDEPIMLRVE